MNISAVVTAKNEAQNITRCVRSLHFADEVIVVDDFSTDNTVALAEAAGARIVQNRWEGFGQQKNAGLSHAQHEWVLFLDADEEIPPDLAQEIQATLVDPQFDVYWLRVLDIFLGKPLRHLMGHNPRLLKRGRARWTSRPVHEQVGLVGPPARIVTLDHTKKNVLAAPLIHHSHDSIHAYLRKMRRYTLLDAQQMVATGRHRSGRTVKATSLLPLQLAVRQFIKLYFWRGGMKDGMAGLTWSYLSARYEWEMGRHFLKLTSG